MYPCFQGNISDVSLLFPLIRPRKVVHVVIRHTAGAVASKLSEWCKMVIDTKYATNICVFQM